MMANDELSPYEDVTPARLTPLIIKPVSSTFGIKRTASQRPSDFGQQVLPVSPSAYGNTNNRINCSRRFKSGKMPTPDKDRSPKSTMNKPPVTDTSGKCPLFYKSGNPSLDSTLHLFEQRICMGTTSGKQNQEEIYFNKSFAGGVFDIDGGYLNLPEFKLTMYIPPRSVAAGLEPIYLHGDRQTTYAPLLSDGEQLISPIITCSKPGKDSHMEQDIVLSFPLYTSCGNGDQSLCDTLQPMRKDIGKDNEWKVLADEIDCLKVVTRGGRCTLMVDKLGCYAIVATNPQASDSGQRTSTVCVGIFGKTHGGSDTVNVVVVFWRDSTADKQRVLAEELQEGLTLMDQARNIPIDEDATEVLVELRNIKPGWSVHDQDHRRKFKVTTLLAQLDSCNLPSCTFALNNFSKAKCSTAQCTVEVCSKGKHAISEPVKFEALIQTKPDPKSSKENKGTSHTTNSQCQLQSQPRPPPCLTYAPLREIATYLGQPTKGPRRATHTAHVWKTFAEKIGLTSSDINEVEGRYHIRSPGGALLDFYFGERLSMRTPRDITANLLTIFKRVGHDDIQALLKRELKRFDQDEQRRKASKPSLEDLAAYDTIKDKPLPMKPSTSPRSKSPVIRRKASHESDNPASTPKLPPRSPSRERPPEPLPKPSNETGLSKSPVHATKSPPKSPKPLSRSPPLDIPTSKESTSQKENNNVELSIYDRPSYPRKRKSFLHSSSAPCSNDRRTQSLPKVPGDETSAIEGVPPEASDSGTSNFISKDFKAKNVKEESAYTDIPENKRQAVPQSSVSEAKVLFEMGKSRQEVQQMLSKAVHKSGVKVKAATTNAVTQLRGMMNTTGKRNQSAKAAISLPMPLRPDQPSPFKDTTSLEFTDALPLYDSVPNEKPVTSSESSKDEGNKALPAPPVVSSVDNVQKQQPEPIYDHPEAWDSQESPRPITKKNEYADSPC